VARHPDLSSRAHDPFTMHAVSLRASSGHRATLCITSASTNRQNPRLLRVGRFTLPLSVGRGYTEHPGAGRLASELPREGGRSGLPSVRCAFRRPVLSPDIADAVEIVPERKRRETRPRRYWRPESAKIAVDMRDAAPMSMFFSALAVGRWWSTSTTSSVRIITPEPAPKYPLQRDKATTLLVRRKRLVAAGSSTSMAVGLVPGNVARRAVAPTA
jgi:hypothetical protein